MHGIYRVIAGSVGKSCHAVGYVGMKKVEKAAGETADAAIDSLKTLLDERATRLREQRVDGVPGEAEFEEALIAMSEQPPRRMVMTLAAHSQRPDAAATIADLARSVGLAESTVAGDYARLGKKLGDLLAFAPRPGEADEEMLPLLTFAMVERNTPDDTLVLRLRPEVVAAIGAIDPEKWGKKRATEQATV